MLENAEVCVETEKFSPELGALSKQPDLLTAGAKLMLEHKATQFSSRKCCYI